jgi:hypothetical protein
MGRFKQVEGEQQQFLPVAAVTRSDIMSKEWVGHLLGGNKAVWISSGIMFRKKNGKMAKVTYFEDPIIERLEWIQQNTEGIIPKLINLWE